MTKIQMIMEIVNTTDDYSYEQLRQLWYAELQVLYHAVVREQVKKDEDKVYDVE